MILTFQSGRDRSMTCSVAVAHRPPNAQHVCAWVETVQESLLVCLASIASGPAPAAALAYRRSAGSCNICHVQACSHPELRWPEHVYTVSAVCHLVHCILFPVSMLLFGEYATALSSERMGFTINESDGFCTTVGKSSDAH
jgi:hypothetical protein